MGGVGGAGGGGTSGGGGMFDGGGTIGMEDATWQKSNGFVAATTGWEEFAAVFTGTAMTLISPMGDVPT